MSDIIKKQIEVYQKSFLEHGDSPKGTNQNDRETQNLRYFKLMKHILDLHKGKFSVHDFGSGLCDLHKYLSDRNIEHDYTGTEIVPEMIETAKKKYPNIQLRNWDIMNDNITEKFDFTIVCGTFCIPGNVPENEWKDFVTKATVKLFEMSNYGISFSHMTTHKTRTDKNQFYMDPAEMLDFCAKHLSRFVLLDHSLPLYEYTVTVFKKDYIHSHYPGEAFSRYFK